MAQIVPVDVALEDEDSELALVPKIFARGFRSRLSNILSMLESLIPWRSTWGHVVGTKDVLMIHVSESFSAETSDPFNCTMSRVCNDLSYCILKQ